MTFGFILRSFEIDSKFILRNSKFLMKRVAGFFLNVIIYAAIVAAIVWGVPKFLAWKLGTEFPIAAITSGSMWPVLKQYDVVLIQKVPKEDLRVGDIVVWQNDKGFTIHRIVKLDADTLTTKGDANFTEDKPVAYSEVIGKTVMIGSKPLRVPYLGYVSVIGGEYRGAHVPASN